MSVHRPAWFALPDAVGVAGQWRPTDLRGLPATLRYGASLAGVALAAARGRPRKLLLVDAGGPVFGADLEALIDAVAPRLASLARSTGAREVALCCGSHRGFVAAVTAAGALGLDALVVPPGAGAESVRDHLRGVGVVVVDAETRSSVRGLVPDAATLDLDGVTASAATERSLRSVPPPRRPGALQLLTSGTSGRPRSSRRAGVAIGQLATLLSLMRALDVRRDEPVLVAPPLAHGHGLSVLTAALVVGAPAVLGHGRDGAGLLQLLHEHEAGVLTVVPAQLSGVLDAFEQDEHAWPASAIPTALRRIATGSAPLPPELLARAQRHGIDVVDFYGSTELGTATIATPEDLRAAPGTVGRPAAGVRIEVVDGAGDPVPPGVVGEVVIHSPWQATSTADGPHAAGDRGHLDVEGRLFLHGRSDDVVVVGGHNVSLERVRRWFAAQPDVETVSVHAVAHDALGHELVAEVTGPVDLDRLADRALAALGSASAPRRLVRGG